MVNSLNCQLARPGFAEKEAWVPHESGLVKRNILTNSTLMARPGFAEKEVQALRIWPGQVVGALALGGSVVKD
jgi:hypothetical protein